MNNNTKLEIAIEIMSAKIAKTSRENIEEKDENFYIKYLGPEK